MEKFVMLDRDGTIIYDTHYLDNPDDVKLLPGAIEGLQKLLAADYKLIVITNQSAIGREYFNMNRLLEIHNRMEEMLLENNITLTKILVCPHTPNDECRCRKPKIGLVEQAVSEFLFDPEQSYMIGDKEADIGLGDNVGAKTILVRTGKGAQCEKDGLAANYIANTLNEAADWICAQKTS